MQAMMDWNKILANLGRQKKKYPQVWAEKNARVLRREKIAGRNLQLQANLQVCEKTFVQECIRKVMYRIQPCQDFFLLFSSPDSF